MSMDLSGKTSAPDDLPWARCDHADGWRFTPGLGDGLCASHRHDLLEKQLADARRIFDGDDARTLSPSVKILRA
jgi:hypothetical protein